MGEVIGDLLPLAVGVAISPVPVIAVILMLFAPKARSASFGFLGGWLAGIFGATLLLWWLAGVTGMAAGDGPSAAASWVKLLLGVLLVFMAVKQWRSRPAPGQVAPLPKWMTAIDSFAAGKAFGLGFLLSAVNPKNLAMCIAAGVAVATGGLPGGQAVTAIVVFTLLAACTVAIPVVAYALAADRMRGPLESSKAWLQANNATVMGVLLLVIGMVLVGKGLGGLI